MKFFAQYLLEKGVISAEALLEAVRSQHAAVDPMLSVAENRGRDAKLKLSEAAAAGQRDDKAVARLTRDLESIAALGETWRTLAEQCVFVMRALVGRCGLTQAALDSHFKAYLAEQRAVSAAPCQDPRSLGGREVPARLLDIVLHLLHAHAGVDFHAVPGELSGGAPPPGAMAMSQRLAIGGDFEANVGFVAQVSVAEALGAKLLSAQDVSCEAAVDAMKELLSVALGHYCSSLSTRGFVARAFPPEPALPASGAAPFRGATVRLMGPSLELLLRYERCMA